MLDNTKTFTTFYILALSKKNLENFYYIYQNSNFQKIFILIQNRNLKKQFYIFALKKWWAQLLGKKYQSLFICKVFFVIFLNSYFYTQQSSPFHLHGGIYIVGHHIIAFYFPFIRKILVPCLTFVQTFFFVWEKNNFSNWFKSFDLVITISILHSLEKAMNHFKSS